MRVYSTISREQVIQLRRALQRWENEGGAVPGDMRSSDIGLGRSSDVNWSEAASSAWPMGGTAHENRSDQ
jgi:hypothetical protein